MALSLLIGNFGMICFKKKLKGGVMAMSIVARIAFLVGTVNGVIGRRTVWKIGKGWKCSGEMVSLVCYSI